MPTSVLTRGRKIVARLTALAMVASIMVIGALPASAEIDTSATCPSSTPSAGFTDIAGQPAHTQLAINCIADYGIAQGFTATTFVPQAEVSRWQMALFLTRQATVHGLTLGNGSDQGFTDIAEYPAATRTAINQLAQLNITQGTTATTYSPAAPVTRWQMALFLTRLLSAAGVTLGDGSDQGFTDIAAFPASTQLAINQIAQAEVSEGFSATTYGPAQNTLRSQMALFLTRTLAADGIVPPSTLVTITPSNAVTLGTNQARTFTADFKNENGSAYTARIGIEILDTSGGAPVYNNPAENVVIEAITDSLGTGTAEANGFPGPNGSVTFTVRNNGTAETVAIVVWQDLNADNGYGGGGNTTPTEPFAVTGAQTFSSVAPDAADSGSYPLMVVGSTIKASNTFTAGVAGQNCGNGVASLCTFSYDENDIFVIEGVATTLAGFESALSDNDVITITYSETAASQSTFNMTADNEADLTVTTPDEAVTVDAATFTISGKADPGATVRVKVDLNNDGDAADAGEGTVATATANADGAWSASVSLTQGTSTLPAANNFVVTQEPVDGDESTPPVNVPTITEGPNVAAKISSTTGANSGATGSLGVGDTVTIMFSEEVVGVGTGDTLSLLDEDGSTATLTCGPDVTCTLSGDGLMLTLSINALVFSSGGQTGGIQPPAQITAVSGFQGADGLAIDVAGSGNGRVFSGF